MLRAQWFLAVLLAAMPAAGRGGTASAEPIAAPHPSLGAIAAVALVSQESADPDGEHPATTDPHAGGPVDEWKGSLPLTTPHAVRDDRGIDCTNVDLEIRIDFDARTIQGRAIHRFLATRQIDLLPLDLTDSLRVTDVHRGAQAAVFTHEGRALLIPLNPPLDPGAPGEVTIRYEGRPPHDGLLGFAFHNRDGVPGAFTVSEPASASGWWPCKDVPNDKLTARITLDVPDTLYAGSNGRLIADENAGGRRRMTWQENWPVAPYLIGIACTKYDPYMETYEAKNGGSLPLLFLPYPEHRALAAVSWGRTSAMLAAFEDRFGPYPFPGEKYGMAEFYWGGAMENQTLTSYGEYLVDGTDQNDWEVAHELAHSWWGNKVTLESWDQMWLNEGFARYAEALWLESQGGIDAYREWMRQMWRPDFPGAVVPPDYIFNSTVYLKGAWVLHMLRGVLGDTIFFSALRTYGDRFAYSNATTEGLIAVFEETAGRGLRWFFDPWIYAPGRPAYVVSWTTEPATTTMRPDSPADRGERGSSLRMRLRTTLNLVIEQTQPEGPFRMPVELEIRDSQGPYRITVEDSLRLQVFRLPVRRPPQDVRLDPDDWILKSTVAGSSASDPGPVPPVARAPWPSPGPPPFRIPLVSAESDGRIEILDAAGRRVAEISANGEQVVTWDGRDAHGRDLPPGVYMIRIAGLPQTPAHRLVLLR